MKKMIAFILSFICLLSIASCARNDDESKLAFEPNNTTASTEASDVTVGSTTTNSSDKGSDAAIKATLIEKYGVPFSFKRNKGMAMWRFTLSDTSAEREYHHSLESSFYQRSLVWDIADGELVITGDWNETFILDLDANIAISKTDGEEYHIYQKDDSLTKYGALQDVVLTFGFPVEIKVLEGMELTILTLNENHAHWELRSNQRPMQYDNLSWSVDGDCLSISGELIESFIIDIVSGSAVSQSTGIEYGIFVMKGDKITSLVE